MTREELQALTSESLPKFFSDTDTGNDKIYEEAKKQYNPKDHTIITDTVARPDKQVKTQDENGQTITKIVNRSRISIPMQKLIVKRAVAFLAGNPITLKSEAKDKSLEANLVDVITKSWNDNKLDFRTKELARIMMSETECAELWYTEPLEEDDTYWQGTANESAKFRLRLRILANSKGDKLYPIYDNMGDMTGFGRYYSVKEAGKNIACFDLYTDKVIRHFRKTEGWTELPAEPNIIGKIPVIYYHQDAVEWADVETLMNRLEEILSDYADMIKYFASPMLKARGRTFSLPAKGEVGKVLQLDGTKDEVDVEYLTWDTKPEAVIFEYEKVLEQIYTMTQTPDISFSSMAGVDNGSGIKLKLMFMDAVLKAMEHWENFGEGIQRRINLIKAFMGKINIPAFEKIVNTTIEPVWRPYIPLNELEEVQKLVDAYQGGIQSLKRTIENNPMVDDVNSELEQITKEKEESQSDVLNIAV